MLLKRINYDSWNTALAVFDTTSYVEQQTVRAQHGHCAEAVAYTISNM